ncbi:unnamed protein product [Thelazia callipaeda]|uniref:Large ribosomal subunit protein eL22 n=1 Tax=Thelazia callipaeda TaxID=103827 RepID=A0A0N5D8R5_THECL|nr:unnamed protein product [Thelazia callipaeda]
MWQSQNCKVKEEACDNSKTWKETLCPKKQKQALDYTIECKNPVEDGVMNANDFVDLFCHASFLNEWIKVNGKVGTMAACGAKLDRRT